MMPVREPAPLFKIIEQNSLMDLKYNIRREPMRQFGLNNIKVTVKVEELLDKVRENRKKHDATYKKAVKVYLEKLTEALHDRQEEVASFRPEKATQEALQELGGALGLAVPRSYLDAYDDVIATLEMATEDKLELDSAQLSMLIRDKWDWQHEFAASTVMYANEAD